MLEIRVAASGYVAYLALILIALAFCGRKALLKAIRRWLRGRK
jgi:hypothetical protein